jgi:putative transposase
VPQSLANILTHVIFSTKDREPLLLDHNLRKRAHAYLATVLKDLQCPAIIIGGTSDHLHILCRLARTQSLSDIMEHLKACSSKWLKAQGVNAFSWQRGYGAFSVSQSHLESVVSYIRNQEEHHRTMTFQEEYRLFLKRYRVAFDERYVWD